MAEIKSNKTKNNLTPSSTRLSGKKKKDSSASSKKQKKTGVRISPGTEKSIKKKTIVPRAAKPSSKTKTAKKNIKSLSPREKKIQEIRINLLSQKDSLLSGAEEALNELPGQTVFPDMGDQASAETDRSFMLRLRGREQRLLKKIDEAVDRIENGTFGICEDCGEEIDIKRLYARPVTTMCIDCKTLQEEEEKLREA